LILIYKKKLNLYRKIKPKDQAQYLISRYPNVNFIYKKQYKTTLKEVKKLKLAYGGLLNKTLRILFKRNFKTISHMDFLKIFESRLDVTLYRSKFGPNIKFIRQLIYQGNVFVNSEKVTVKSFLLTPGDIIKVKLRCSRLLEYYTRKSDNWPVCPKHLIVNYKTMQIVFCSLKNNNLSLNIFYHLRMEKLLLLFKASL
jgi:ribosomal protein S4